MAHLINRRLIESDPDGLSNLPALELRSHSFGNGLGDENWQLGLLVKV